MKLVQILTISILFCQVAISQGSEIEVEQRAFQYLMDSIRLKEFVDVSKICYAPYVNKVHSVLQSPMTLLGYDDKLGKTDSLLVREEQSRISAIDQSGQQLISKKGDFSVEVCPSIESKRKSKKKKGMFSKRNCGWTEVQQEYEKRKKVS